MSGSIKAVNIGKAYKKYSNRWSRLIEWVSPFYKKQHELTWILKEINFTISPGEAVGIIGINGAGKSTLLKLITGTAKPSTGSIFIDGQVSAMLELGMGFHPDFTGRANVIMAAQLMGYNDEEIEEVMPEVEAFAEIGNYIDQPVRVYSSGMQVRLAFSIATARRPDILIVDEALSVGDDYFQHKSFDRIRKFSKMGTTLLIVSHDKSAIQTLCDRAILLDKGCIAQEGKPEAIMNFYNAMIAEREKEDITQEEFNNGKTQTTSGTGEVKTEDIGLYNCEDQRIENVRVGESVILKVRIRVVEKIKTLVLGYVIKDRLGQDMYGTNTWYTKQVINNLQIGDRYQFNIKYKANLGIGSYSVSIALHEQNTHISANYYWQDLALVFNVINTKEVQFVGNNWMEPEIKIKPYE